MTEVDETELIETTVGHIRYLRMDRPARLNALSRSLEERLTDAVLSADVDPEIRVIVVGATGDRAFCAGVDLKELAAADDAGVEYHGPMHSARKLVYEVIAECKKPTIAALNGVAVGAGCEIALACDLRIAAEGVRFGLPEAKRGMGAIFASAMLPRRVPMGVALEMMFTGEFLGCDDAYRLGLLNRIVPRDKLDGAVAEFAGSIARNAPLSVQRMKAMALRGVSLPLASALRLDAGPNPYTSEDRREGIRAFLEHRDPVWQGR